MVKFLSPHQAKSSSVPQKNPEEDPEKETKESKAPTVKPPAVKPSTAKPPAAKPPAAKPSAAKPPAAKPSKKIAVKKTVAKGGKIRGGKKEKSKKKANIVSDGSDSDYNESSDDASLSSNHSSDTDGSNFSKKVVVAKPVRNRNEVNNNPFNSLSLSNLKITDPKYAFFRLEDKDDDKWKEYHGSKVEAFAKAKKLFVVDSSGESPIYLLEVFLNFVSNIQYDDQNYLIKFDAEANRYALKSVVDSHYLIIRAIFNDCFEERNKVTSILVNRKTMNLTLLPDLRNEESVKFVTYLFESSYEFNEAYLEELREIYEAVRGCSL